ncbi:MAG: nucleotide exchange factor GrpE [Alkalinema sp. RU_4_3]|nr:nucleotide exchange factor GrpE [Alkalinema sp. RU_4_3]
MIEETNPLEEAAATQAPPSSESNAENIEELLEDNGEIPELIDPEASPSEAAPPSASSDEDETDYEAAFLELRGSYAAKERECEALKTQSDDRQNQYLRLAADFENFRRRTQKEKEDLEVQIKINSLGELLSVVDNFERARSHLKPQTDSELTMHKSYQGVYKDMVDRLKKLGVSPMRSEGQMFDPNLHEAVMREPTDQHPEGTVVEELVAGYMIGERVLRHAMVKVAAAPEDG